MTAPPPALPSTEQTMSEDNPKKLIIPERAEAEDAVRTLLRWAGDDPDREGLTDTPRARGTRL